MSTRKEVALLLNRLILMASAKGGQQPDEPPEDRITDADVDALEARILALVRSQDEEPPVGVYALRDVVRSLRETGRFVDDEGEAANALEDLEHRLTHGGDASQVCHHGIHTENACGACVPPRGTTVAAQEDAHPSTGGMPAQQVQR